MYICIFNNHVLWEDKSFLCLSYLEIVWYFWDLLLCFVRLPTATFTLVLG